MFCEIDSRTEMMKCFMSEVKRLSFEKVCWNPAWAKVSIRYYDISLMLEPPVQICAFLCLRKLQKGYSYMLGPRAVTDYHATA